MSQNNEPAYVPSEKEKSQFYDFLKTVAEKKGYHLNPDRDFVMELAEGLLINKQRYGYLSCPCRLASGDKQADRDIVCPCAYRDADLLDFDACFCALYVSDKIIRKEAKAKSIPDRRKII